MELLERVQLEIKRCISRLKTEQHVDGSWRYYFETGPVTDAYMMILLSTLNSQDKRLIPLLGKRLLSKQAENGAWKQYDDDEGHLSSTIEAYTGLLLSGYSDRHERHMQLAEAFILRNGGVENAHISTKFMLALNHLYHWPAFYPTPLFLLHMPKFIPFSFYRWSSYVRTHFAPVLILCHRKFSLRKPSAPDITHLFVTRKYKRLDSKGRWLQVFSKHWPANPVSKAAIKKAERYMLQNIVQDGTLSSYASATFFMIYALLSLGYQSDSPIIQHAIQGLTSYGYQINDEAHIQNSPSTVWDTALICHSLQEAGLTTEDPMIQNAAQYLLALQQRELKEGGGSTFVQLAGGWGFSESSTTNPDVDDTQAVLRALTRFADHQLDYREAWRKGVNWLLGMQNDDGGWAAFEKNSIPSITRLFRIQNFADTAADPSAADVTGRTLEFLGSHLKLAMTHHRVQASVHWLIKNQKNDGSWYGRWGISFIYGTWAAVTGMRAVGMPADHPTIQQAVDWLLKIRQLDGGWGESCKSDIHKKYVPAPYSTVVHTAWALDTLIAIHDQPTEEINKGLAKLMEWNRQESKRSSYPTGAGLPGHFYIHYHSYPHIWPLLTLSHYMKKYKDYDM
ncbi:squalene--hopene cyclase [Paenibacillus selenitireducens]|uniref:Squalene--hopene cyclase n=1 Tax=Paenibacillus selenitireducens TaxID=1324314 RepID=A0A1T2XLP5_9BACL|nr:prenyltransferase/squalene oxidase repeat-containing protein [Paenibacillus selenitireducens]OPA80787.1 squalene--hopene cyclase [Paenibacillus selenitireducens]